MASRNEIHISCEEKIFDSLWPIVGEKIKKDQIAK